MKNLNKYIFIVATIFFIALLIPSFFSAWAEDEGTLQKNSIGKIFNEVYYILRFPTHTLLWSIFSINGLLFSAGLIINCMFYGLLIERIVYFIRLKSVSKTS